MNPSYECPVCEEWVEILPTTPKENFRCPWCGQALRLDVDAEFANGMWHDLSKLVTRNSHWDEDLGVVPKSYRDWVESKDKKIGDK